MFVGQGSEKRFELPVMLLVVWLALCPWPVPESAAGNGTTDLKGRIIALTAGWLYRWNALSPSSDGYSDGAAFEIPGAVHWEPYDLERPLQADRGRILWLKKTLNDAEISSAALFIPHYSSFRSFEVYLDHVRIYKSGELKPAFINRHLYIKWHLIPLPFDYYNRTLYFRFFSDHPRIIGIVSTIYLGQIPTVLTRLVLQDLDITILGLFLILGGLFGGSLLVAYYKLKNHSLLYGSIMSISAGAYILTESNVTSMIFDHTVLQSYVHYASFFVFAGGAWAFLEQTVGAGRKRLYRWGGLFQITYLVVAMLLDLLEVLSWDVMFDAGMALLGITIVAAEWGLWKMVVAGDPEARLLCAGFGLLGLSGGWDILAGLGVVSPQRVVFPWALVLLLVSVAVVLILRYRAERSAAEETLRRSEERFRNLFENAPISILEVDYTKARPIVIHANTPTVELFGLPMGEIVPLPLANLFLSEALPDLCRALDSLGAATRTALESHCLRQGKTVFPARITASLMPIFGLGRVVLTIEDITEEKERQSEEEAITEERCRIAREIHDGLAQDLAAMSMKASVWHLLVDGKPEQMLAEIERFRQLLKKNLHEVRRCIFALRPVELEELGFFEAVRRFIRDFGDQNQIHVSFNVIGPENELSHRLEPVLFRIVQETLNNARKHAAAEAVRIDLDIAAGRCVTLDVHDNGKGFDTAMLKSAFRNGHLGIRQMHERIVKHGGVFHIQSSGDKGTNIRVVLPLTG